MNDQPEQPNSQEQINLGSEKLKLFFIKHLNRIYYAKLHLISRLPDLADEVHYADLKSAIIETVNDVEKQLARLELIYTLMDEQISQGSIHGLAGLIDDAFESIKEES